MNIYMIIIFILYNLSVVNGIYGGRVTSIYLRPWQASIQLRDYHICGGSIISRFHILTAASCISAAKNIIYGNIEVLIGSHALMTTNGQIIQVKSVIIHENYSPHNFWSNDIAILKVPKINFQVCCKAATLADTSCIAKKFLITGWGIDPTTNILPRYLKELSVKSTTSKICQSKYYETISFNRWQFCLLPQSTSARITEGVGGSPVQAGSNIVGIVSLISTKTNYPAVYTRLYGYLDWIKNIIKKY